MWLGAERVRRLKVFVAMNRGDSKGAGSPQTGRETGLEISFVNRNRLVVGASAALCGVPVVVDLLLSQRAAPFRYFTSDAFYYLNIARNFANTGLFSFDGVHPTNGFHPLWQLLVAFLYKACLVLHLNDLAYCYLVVLLGTAFLTLAVLILGRTISRTRGEVPTSFTLLPVGVYAFVLSPVWLFQQDVLGNVSPAEGPFPLYGTVWSYANGMESSLALLSFALLGLFWTRVSCASHRSALTMGLMGAFVVLARLDQVFIASSILGGVACRWIRSEREKAARHVILLGGSFALPVSLYLLLNVLYCGSAFPVSGASKLSFEHVGRANFHGLHSVVTVAMNSPYWLDRFFRLTQLVLPSLAAVAFLLGTFRVVRTRPGLQLRRRVGDAFTGFVMATAIGVLALCVTIFLFTSVPAYGSWSLPVPVLFVSLAVLSLSPPKEPSQSHAMPFLAAYAGVCVLVFVTMQRQPEYHERYRRFFQNREAVANHYAGHSPKVIEYDDGIIGFATHFHTLSAFNLATDKDLYDAIRGNRLLSLSRSRGYDRVASVTYLPSDGDGDAALNVLSHAFRGDTSAKTTYSLEYFDASIPFAVARIRYANEEAR